MTGIPFHAVRGLERVAQPIDDDRRSGAADTDEASDGRAQSGPVGAVLLADDGTPSTRCGTGLVAGATLGIVFLDVGVDCIQRGHAHALEEPPFGSLLAGEDATHVLLDVVAGGVRRSWRDLQIHGLDHVVNVVVVQGKLLDRTNRTVDTIHACYRYVKHVRHGYFV